MKPIALILLLAAGGWSSSAEAYWQRSHWAACSEAPTEAERFRLNCYIFAPSYDWPLEPFAIEQSRRHLPRARITK